MFNSIDQIKNLLILIAQDDMVRATRPALEGMCQQAVTYLNHSEFRTPLYFVLDEPGPDQHFIELEDEQGLSRSIGRMERYPGKSELWWLGPFVILPEERAKKSSRAGSPGEQAQEVVPGVPAPPASKDERDGALPAPGSVEREELLAFGVKMGHEFSSPQYGDARAACSCGKWRLLLGSLGGPVDDSGELTTTEFLKHLRPFALSLLASEDVPTTASDGSQ